MRRVLKFLAMVVAVAIAAVGFIGLGVTLLAAALASAFVDLAHGDGTTAAMVKEATT